MKKRKIGIIGYGIIAKSTHTIGYLNCTDIAEVVAVCDIKEEALAIAREKLGIKEEYCFTDYHDLIACEEVEAVDICTPNYMHCEIAHAIIQAGKPFAVEKPVGMTYSEVLKLYEDAASLPAFVSFSFRFHKQIRYIKEQIENGVIGDIRNIYLRYSKNSALRPGRRLEWRFDKELAGTGALGDFGSHMLDLVRLFCGDIVGVYAEKGTVITERQRLDSDEIAPVTTDDWCHILGKTAKGASLSVSVSRCATSVKGLTEIEIYGTKGSLFYSTTTGLVRVGDMDEIRTVEVPDEYLGNQSATFVNFINGITDMYTPTLADGLACQKVLEAAALSCENGRYVRVDEI